MEQHEADIAIRFAQPENGDIISRPLVTVGLGFYGTEEACRSVQAGGELILIGFDETEAYLSGATWITRQFPRVRLAFRANDQFAQSVAARSGVGLALLPHYIGRSDPLLRVCDLGAAPPSKDVFMLTRRRDKTNRSIRAVTEEVSRIFEESRKVFL